MMAQFGGRLWLLAASLAVAFHATWAGLPTIRFKGEPKLPLLEGSNVTLECLTDEPGEDLSGFTFQKYSTWLHTWISLDKVKQLRCWFFDVAINREDGRLWLSISDLQPWHTGLYRCTGSNSTGNASASQELELSVEYLHGILLTRANTWCGTLGDSVTVLEGSTLALECSADASQHPHYHWKREGEEWAEESSALTLAEVSREHTGTYTCKAQHPLVPRLIQTKSIRVFVEGHERAYTLDSVVSLSTPMLALAVALPAVLLLLVVMVVAFLIPRHRAAAKKKAALEETGQRTPIYKGSLESVPSVVADTHPLVI